MQVEFSKAFVKDLRKLPKDIMCSLHDVVEKIGCASTLHEISNCKKMQGADNVYRIRIRDYRALFLFIQIDDKVFFQRILTRGQIYKSL